jgi:farnesyl diphosphate synthase
LQAFFLVADDIMDHSVTRRGQPCWYLVPSVGNMAINDSFILESAIYRLIKKYFKSTDYYGDLLELFHEVTYQTELGQLMDLMTAPEGDVDMSRFSLERYYLIVEYKTAYYSFYLPVALAMLMAGVKDESLFKQAKDILIPLGKFFQIQDDYLDCFGDPAVIGKIGTDIEDNKCSWLVVQALDRANAAQRQHLESMYGQKDVEKVKAVKKLYADLDLESVYRQYEETSFKQICEMIDLVDDQVLPRAIFLDFAKRIYKRQK